MKFEAFDNAESVKEEPIKLRLYASGGGHITVGVVNEGGDTLPGGHLITFRTDGNVVRHSSVSGHFGFKQDGRGRIMERD